MEDIIIMIILFNLTFLLIASGILDWEDEQEEDCFLQLSRERKQKVVINNCNVATIADAPLRNKKRKINTPNRREIEALKIHLNQYIFPEKKISQYYMPCSKIILNF